MYFIELLINMIEISFTVSSQTIPYVEMKLSGKNKVMIPVGRMLNMMEEMLATYISVVPSKIF